MKKYFLLIIILVIADLFIIQEKMIASIPPHPRVLQMIKDGKIPLPYHLAKPQEAIMRGINAPFNRNIIDPIKSNKSIEEMTQLRALVILVRFTDNPSHVQPVFFDSLTFGKNGSTLRNYFNEVSYNTIDIVTVDFPSNIGWINAPQTYSYYVNNQNGFGSYPQNAQKLAEDVVAAVNGVVDFSLYDNDHDSYVDALFIVHAGPGAEYTGNGADIWSHAWGTYSPQYVDGVYVQRYSMEPEYWSTPGDMTCGVYAHEAGHAVFGLPDLYDYDYDSQGLGRWSLMAGGSWNGNLGNSPAHPDAWSRYKMGLLSPIDLHRDSVSIGIPAVNSSGVVYRLWTEGVYTNEYFLIENRQRVGYDTYLPGSGLCIYHVDEYQYNNNGQWYPGYTSYGHYRVALEQADGQWDLEKNNSYGDNGDPFPGSTGNRTFNYTSTPNSRSYTDQQTSVSVSNISDAGSIMWADLSVQIIPPNIEVSPLSIEGSIAAGDTLRSTVTIKNTGDGELIYSIPLINQVVAANKKSGANISGIKGGGPDAFGYRWVDSRDTNGTQFAWIDISTIGTELHLVPYGSSGYLPIGFNFPFYDSIFSKVSVNATGFISFTADGFWVPIFDVCPSEWNPPSIIAILAADLNPRGPCYYYSDTTNGRFIIQFNEWSKYNVDTAMYTMEIILNKDGRIKFQYLYMANGLMGMKGIQNQQRNIGLNVNPYYPGPVENYAVEILLIPDWVAASPSQGTVAPGDSEKITLTFDSNVEVPSLHEGNIFIVNNDPDESSVPISLSYTVRDEPNISLSLSDIDFGTIYYNELATYNLLVRNVGSQPLSVSSIISGNVDLSVDSLSYWLPPKSSRLVKLNLIPSHADDFTSFITINSNDVVEPSITLAVKAIVEFRPKFVFTPTPIQFTLPRGDSSSASLVIANEGLGSLEVQLQSDGREYAIGTIENAWDTRGSIVGNIYTFSSIQILDEYQTLLKLSMPQEVAFAIYESTTKSGIYKRQWQSIVTIDDTTMKYVSSGYVNFLLQPNRYYYFSIGFSWDARFYLSAMPAQPEFGKVEGGSIHSAYPPTEELSIQPNSKIQIQKLTLSSSVISDILPRSSTISPGSSDTFNISIKALAKFGLHETNIKINSNDPDYPVVLVPTSLNISGLLHKYDLGWNIFSIPFRVPDFSKQALFSNISTPAFEYRNGYTIRETLQVGKAYWINLPDQYTSIIQGDVVTNDTLDLKQGWNLIGSLSYNTPRQSLSAILPMQVLSSLIGFSGSEGYYNSDTIESCQGYWLKVSTDGRIVIKSENDNQILAKNSGIDDKYLTLGLKTEDENIARLNFIDADKNIRTLFFSLNEDEIDLDKYDLPPVPPQPTFDVRYSSQKNIASFVNSDKIPIVISGGKTPILIEWSGWDVDADIVLKISDREVALHGEGNLLVEDLQSDRIILSKRNKLLPQYYELQQNHPNPFNPSTVIRYQLPVESKVIMKIYNMIGQEMCTLVDEIQDAGFKVVEWNSTNISSNPIASGVYFYKLEAIPIADPVDPYMQVRKMIIMK
jgi:immune inhibitor A